MDSFKKKKQYFVAKNMRDEVKMCLFLFKMSHNLRYV